MSQEQATLLKRALIQGVSERYDAELAENKKSVACSQAHLLKMSEILGYDVQKTQKVRKIIAAAIILAAALAIGTLTVCANRDQIRDFFIQVYEGYIVLKISGDPMSSTITEHYEVKYIPNGYVMIKEDFTILNTYYEWVNDTNKTLSFSQWSLGADINLNGEDGNMIVIEHNDLHIYCIQYDDSISYTWNDGKYILDIHDRTGLPIDEIMKIIDSIHKKE